MSALDDMVLAALVESGEVAPDVAARVRRAALEPGGSLRGAALALGVVDERRWTLGAAEVSEYPFVDLADFEVNHANAGLVPRALAESLRAFALFSCDGVVTVGMADPLDFRAVDQLRSLLGAEVDPVHCEPGALGALIERAYAITGARGEAERAGAGASAGALTTGREPIVAAVNQILAQGVDLGASDIHLGADDSRLHLRYRVDGVLRAARGPGLEAHAGIVQRLKVMADLDLTQSRRPQDGKFRFRHAGADYDVRLSLIPTVCGENAVLRLLRGHASVGGLAELGFPGEQAGAMEALLEEPHGMILVTGPTGSGKTTTLYALLSRLNQPDVNIITIEDPVEIRLPVVRQVQVNPGVGLTFAGALRSALRQDPDVILVGEVRDEETARISVQSALTGHLVLSSLHTNDAAGAVPRLRDLSVPSFAVNAALLCVVAQRLVRRVCPDCAAPERPPEALLRRMRVPAGAGGFRRGAGCARCAGVGLRGRVGLYEMLTMTGPVRDAVERGDGASALRALALRSGMRPLRDDGLAKAMAGVTTLDEVARATSALGDDAMELAPVDEGARQVDAQADASVHALPRTPGRAA